MAKSDLTWRFFGKDVSASRALKGVGAAAENSGRRIGAIGGKMGMAFAGIGTAAVAAGAVIAVDFGKQSVSAFMDAQESQTKFEGSLAKNGLKAYTDDIDALAQSLATKTKFDDDATKSGAAVLANFGLTGKQLEQVIPLVQDYAAFTGKDMTTASKALGKAFGGSTKALKELGIQYKPTGDKAKDMAAIMKLVSDRVGGFAEKQGKTAAGTAEILKNQFGELQEKVGSALLPILMKLAPIGLVLVDWLSKAADGIGIFIDAFSGKSEFNEFDGALRIVNNAGIVFREVWDAAAQWITGTLWPAIKTLADGFMQNVWPAIQNVAGIIASNLQPVIEALATFWTETLWPAIQRLIPVFARVAQVVGIVVGALAVAISWIIGKVAPVLYKILAPAIGFVVTVLEKVSDGVGWVIDHFGDMVEFFKGLPDKFKSAFKTAADIITAPFRIAFNAIATLWNNTVGKLSFTIPDWIPGIGGNGFDVPDIPMLANGGIVTRPTLALVGEAGPEAVIPLSRGGGMGPQVVVNITSPLGTPDQIARAVQSAIRRSRGNGGLAGAV